MENNQNSVYKISFWKWLKKWWFLHVIILGCLGLIFTWGHWVTVSIYAKDTRESVVQEAVTTLKKDVEEIKTTLKDNAEKREKDQKNMYDILLDINKEVKKKGWTFK